MPLGVHTLTCMNEETKLLVILSHVANRLLLSSIVLKLLKSKVVKIIDGHLIYLKESSAQSESTFICTIPSEKTGLCIL